MAEQKKKVIVAPVGKDMDSIFIAIKEFPTDHVVLISTQDMLTHAQQTQRELERFKIPAYIKKINGPMWESLFEAISQIKADEQDKFDILVNVSSGDRGMGCAATSAAFVNGAMAFGADEKGAMLLPVLKFSYYKLLTNKKMQILRLLYDQNCCSSLEELSKKTKMSLPLVSYHINGTRKSEGLKTLGLVDTLEEGGRIEIKLSTQGRLLIKGYIPMDYQGEKV